MVCYDSGETVMRHQSRRTRRGCVSCYVVSGAYHIGTLCQQAVLHSKHSCLPGARPLGASKSLAAIMLGCNHAWLSTLLPSHSCDMCRLSERVAATSLTLAFSASVRREVGLSLEDFGLFCFWCLPLQTIILA